MTKTTRIGCIMAIAALLLGWLIVTMNTASPQGKSGDQYKVVICHVPPGNPDNAHTIEVSENAVDAHLAHGDYLGACQPTGGTTVDEPETTVPVSEPTTPGTTVQPPATPPDETTGPEETTPGTTVEVPPSTPPTGGTTSEATTPAETTDVAPSPDTTTPEANTPPSNPTPDTTVDRQPVPPVEEATVVSEAPVSSQETQSEASGTPTSDAQAQAAQANSEAYTVEELPDTGGATLITGAIGVLLVISGVVAHRLRKSLDR